VVHVRMVSFAHTMHDEAYLTRWRDGLPAGRGTGRARLPQ